MDRQSSAPGASAISDGSRNLAAGGARGVVPPWLTLLSSIAPSSARPADGGRRKRPCIFAQVRTAEAATAFRAGQWRIQPFRSARSWAIHQGEENGTVGAMIGEQQTMARSGNSAGWEHHLAAQHRALQVSEIVFPSGY